MHCSGALSATCQIYATGKVSMARRTSVNELLAAASRPSLHPRRSTTPAVITSKDFIDKENNSRERSSSTISSIIRRFIFTTTNNKKPHQSHEEEEENRLISYSTSLDDYQRLYVLGVGGTATVYACKHKLTKTVVAVKQIDLELLDLSHESKRLDGLRREIQIMKLCRHKHLLPTFQSFVNSCYVYIVMPMMSFGSCRDLLTNFFPEGLDESLVACIIKQVVKGLQYLHENGLLHRDIKAANLLLDDGTVILADFGVSNHLLANTTSEQGNPTLRRRRSFLGTPFFMAPEILQHHEYNQNVDIWALGISTLELATGWPPLCDHDASSVFSHVIHDPPPILESNDYSPACHDFIACCLRKSPTERISADEASYHPFLVQAPPPTYLDQFLQQLDWSSSGPYTNSLSDNNTINPSFLYTSSSFASSSSASLHITNHDHYHHYTNDNNTDWDFSNHPPSPLFQKPLELLSCSPPPPLPTVTCHPPSLYDNDSLCDEHVPITPEEEISALSKPFVHDRMLLLNTPSDFHLF